MITLYVFYVRAVAGSSLIPARTVKAIINGRTYQDVMQYADYHYHNIDLYGWTFNDHHLRYHEDVHVSHVLVRKRIMIFRKGIGLQTLGDATLTHFDDVAPYLYSGCKLMKNKEFMANLDSYAPVDAACVVNVRNFERLSEDCAIKYIW